MKRIIALMVTFLVSMSFAHAEWIGEFPGLDKLIKDADAIAILRVDHSECDFGGMEPYSTHNCYVYQTLKGDIPANKQIRLKLMNSRSHFVSSFAYHSTLLVFLTKKGTSNEVTDYRAMQIKGSTILVPPTGQETAPKGESVLDKVRSILQRAVEYNEKEYERERAFLLKAIQGDAKN